MKAADNQHHQVFPQNKPVGESIDITNFQLGGPLTGTYMGSVTLVKQS